MMSTCLAGDTPAHAAHFLENREAWEDNELLSQAVKNDYTSCAMSLNDAASALACSELLHSDKQTQPNSGAAGEPIPLQSKQEAPAMDPSRSSFAFKRKRSVDNIYTKRPKRARTNSEPFFTLLSSSPPRTLRGYNQSLAPITAERDQKIEFSNQVVVSNNCESVIPPSSELPLPQMSDSSPMVNTGGFATHISGPVSRKWQSPEHSPPAGSARLQFPNGHLQDEGSARTLIPSHSPDIKTAKPPRHPAFLDPPQDGPTAKVITPTKSLRHPAYLSSPPDRAAAPSMEWLPDPSALEALEETTHPVVLPMGGTQVLPDAMDIEAKMPPQHSNPAPYETNVVPLSIEEQSIPTSVEDQQYVNSVKQALQAQGKWKTANVGRRQARRILELLEIGRPPTASEAWYLTSDTACTALDNGVFFPGPIITTDEQTLPLQTTTAFLSEFYDDTAKVWIQDPAIRLARNVPHAREVTLAQLKARFQHPAPKASIPWNCLEMATHVEDGLRPRFLNNEDCRLLTKLKIPRANDSASRRGYEPGWKEVEKWALLAQGGALTEPHQDSHGYSTYITVNQGVVGFGWLANPSCEERRAWRHDPTGFVGGRWRYVVLRAGQTVFFPSGTVHFVFRLRALGDTLAFGGHVLRCSQIVRWVQAMLEEKEVAEITNEDLTVSAPAYLERVEKFVTQAMGVGLVERWGGKESIEKFLQLKEEFLGNP